MDIIVGDLETFWSPTHSLTKMNPIDYVMHPDTEIISNSLKVNGGPAECVFGEDNVRAQLNAVNWDNAYFIGHNFSGFDAMIYAWRLGITPRIWGCTLAMARPIHAKTIGVSLATLVKHYGVGVKNNAALLNTKGKHLKDFTPAELRDMARYNCDDSDQCFELFKRLKPHYTTAELWHLDSKIRALVEPKLMIDVPLLEEALKQERINKRNALLEIAEHFKTQVSIGGAMPESEEYLIERVRATLASAPMFSQLLESRGVPVPMKPSPTNEEVMIPALAKVDLGFIALQDHDDPVVAMAATARLDVKSTIAETRMQKFVDVAKYTGGKWPCTVSYCGADTTGRSSGWFYNPLNLPRIDSRFPKPADALRNSLMAPPGYKVVVVDASGIEMRFNHFLWNVRYSTDLWRADPSADIYKPTAAKFFMVDVSAVDKTMRQVGKVQQLACGFQCGKYTYVDMARTMGGLRLSLEAADQQVKSWREMTPEIANYNDGGWTRCQESLEAILNGMERAIDPRGIFTTCAEGILLPSGRLIRYPSLRRQQVMRKDRGTGHLKQEWSWQYGEKRHTAFIYGGKVDENCIAEGTLVLTGSGWTPIEQVTVAHQVHDGVQFVRHSGIVLKSVQACVEVDGVLMTPDHEVLTDEGWKEASQFPRPYRPNVRRADRLAPVPHERQEVVLGVPMSVRADRDAGRGRRVEGSGAAGHPELRLLDSGAAAGEERNSRHVETSGVCGVPQHVGPVRAADASGMGQLRRAWHNGTRPMARIVRELLGGHGADVPVGVRPGTGAQHGGVFADELQVGYAPGQHNEQAQHGSGDRRHGDGACKRYQQVDPVLPDSARVVSRGPDAPPLVFKPVYDIINAGPRRRFVVLGNEGPFVVHNCVQAGARDVVFDAALQIFKRTGFRPVQEVYDELVYVVPEDMAQEHLAICHEEMRRSPKWFPDLVLWSEGDIGDRYGEAK